LSISDALRSFAVAALVNALDTSRPERVKLQSFPTTSQGVKGTVVRCSSPVLTVSGMFCGMRVLSQNAKKASSKDISHARLDRQGAQADNALVFPRGNFSRLYGMF
jgi:hypothetical protein